MTREEAIRLIGWLKCTTNREDDLEAIDMAIEALSADAVPFEVQLQSTREVLDRFAENRVKVVRCKDCKNWRESHSEDEESYCYIDGRTIDSTDYCSWGERREE